MIGSAAARAVLEPLSRAKPGTVSFISSPRTQRHAASIHTLLTELLEKRPASDALCLVSDFATAPGFSFLRLQQPYAKSLAAGVAEAIEMLSLTLPAAFDSDSTRVARLALDEELRSGHDTAIDALKRKALSHNIGVLRTPMGYAVAPMHEGRVVAPDVFKALPAGLKAGVEAKLEAFETELSGVLASRSRLQQDYYQRVRELERELASLAVRASLSNLTASFANAPAIVTWLNALSSDLTKNANLFVSAASRANSQPRAPIELANDPTLARYRVNILNDKGAIITPHTLDLAELFGTIHATSAAASAPAAVHPGALTRAASGFLLIDARDLLAQYATWPRLKQGLKRGATNPLNAANAATSVFGLEVPIEARVIVTGDADDYTAWCALDADVPRLVRHIKAYAQTIPVTATVTHDFNALSAAIVRDEALLPIDASAIAALLDANTTTQNRVRYLLADLDALPTLMTEASHLAASRSQSTITASDIRDALHASANSAAGPA